MLKCHYEVYIEFKDGTAQGGAYTFFITALANAKWWRKKDNVDKVSIILYKRGW